MVSKRRSTLVGSRLYIYICIYIYTHTRVLRVFCVQARPSRIAVSRDWCWWWWEECEGTNLGTVRMEMPCRCYSHLHSRLSIQTPLSLILLLFFLYLFLSSTTLLPLTPLHFLSRFGIRLFFFCYRRLESVGGWRVIWRFFFLGRKMYRWMGLISIDWYLDC